MKFYTSTPSEHVGGRSVIVPSARCIEGGSSVNFMIYNRPSAPDFDDWENEFDNPGWGAKDMIPMLQKAETYDIEPGKPTHGSSGPLKVSFGGDAMLDIGRQLLETGAKFEKDRPVSDEGNGLDEDSINVFFRCPKWISSDGRRSDVAHHYIYNKSLGNLSVFDGCLVNRVVIENGVATGVEFLLDKHVYDSAPQDVRTVKVRRVVFASAGTMGSPLILERSRIGKKEILEKAGISLVHELSGVGENYQDHPFYASPHIVDPNSATLDAIFRGDPETWRIASAQWEKDGSGLLSTNGIESCIKIRPRLEELPELGPDFTDYWNSVLANKPDKPLSWITVSPGLPVDQSALPSVRYMVSACILGYPASRGYLHISPAHVIALRWAYKKCRELTRRLPSFCGALRPAHPKFAQDSPAALTDVGPLPLEAPKIVYSAEDDEAIDTNVRQSVQTAWHSVCHSLFMPGLYIDVLLQLGTCAMKSLGQGGVVDSKLNVYGIANLKVADMSIAPSNVNSNTYSTAVAIGERAATRQDFREIRYCIEVKVSESATRKLDNRYCIAHLIYTASSIDFHRPHYNHPVLEAVHSLTHFCPTSPSLMIIVMRRGTHPLSLLCHPTPPAADIHPSLPLDASSAENADCITSTSYSSSATTGAAAAPGNPRAPRSQRINTGFPMNVIGTGLRTLERGILLTLAAYPDPPSGKARGALSVTSHPFVSIVPARPPPPARPPSLPRICVSFFWVEPTPREPISTYGRATRHTCEVTTVRSPVRAFAFVRPSRSTLRSPLLTYVRDPRPNMAVAGAGAGALLSLSLLRPRWLSCKRTHGRLRRRAAAGPARR
ncbi:GMC oxidoreductase-domain-containing protein [Mycena vulgaris]|nr:GMC oxidoreductase-domain-containing protein [Mycena vulgaris]